MCAVTNLSMCMYICLEKVHGVHQLPAPAGDEEW